MYLKIRRKKEREREGRIIRKFSRWLRLARSHLTFKRLAIWKSLSRVILSQKKTTLSTD